MSHKGVFYNQDCITGAAEHIEDNAVDLIITDPPYGIDGDKLDRHYNRKEEYVVEGYVEVPADGYEDFSRRWITQAERILKPGGSMYIVSGYTNLFSILKALKQTELTEINHIIWKYNFGVYTTRKYVSSHYHVLYYVKPGEKYTFNTHCRFGPLERDEEGGSLNYQDREDVWIINKEYKKKQKKYINKLPTALLSKMIRYSSHEGDLVCDLFLGSFSTARVALGLNRQATGFELSRNAYNHGIADMQDVKPGDLLSEMKQPEQQELENQGKSWSGEEKREVFERYKELYQKLGTKRDSITILSEEFGRGRFSLRKIISEME